MLGSIISFLLGCVFLVLFFYIGSFVLTFIIGFFALIVAGIVSLCKAIYEAFSNCKMEITKDCRNLLDGEDISDRIRTQEINTNICL